MQVKKLSNIRSPKSEIYDRFFLGLYCTNQMQQAICWANREIGEPIINFYEYEPNESLNILKFPEISNEWLDFIAKCRSGATQN